MAWTAPVTHVAATTLTAATLNAQIRDNFNAAFPVGSIHYFMQNATTAETTINGFALEMNAVSVLRATYANLNTLLGALGYPFGTVDGTHMTLPDGQGRALISMSSGGHTDVNGLNDNDGVVKANRTPRHNTTNGLSMTGAPGLGTLAITPNPHRHSILITPGGGAVVAVTQGSAGGSVGYQDLFGANPGINDTSLSVTGAPSVGTLGLTGSIGIGGSRPFDSDTYIVVGIYAVKY